MISSSCWVPRGYASEFPEKYELDDAEMERISQMANLELNDAEEELNVAEKKQTEDNKIKAQIEIDDDLKEYDLENYDEDDKAEGVAVSMFPGLSSTDAKYHQEGEESDPYLSLPTETDAQEEKQESQIYPSDNLVLATRTEDDISYLDVYVYDDGAGAPKGSNDDDIDDDIAKGYVRDSNLYIHHDIMLPAFPLCVEWINFRPGSEGNANIGNFAAVGTFDPQIEVWNLDYVDKAFPDLILGEPQGNSLGSLSKSKKKKKKLQHVTSHHTDAVLSIAHNKLQRSILASTSADKTLKLWDLNNGIAVRSLKSIHESKVVSSSQWHLEEESLILTGGYDGYSALTDVRIADELAMSKKYKVSPGEEVENVRWGSSSEMFYAGTDNGNVYCFDVRNEERPLWTLHAHDSGISSLDINLNIPGLVATSAMNDKVVKLWKCPDQSQAGGPSMVLSRDLGVGNVLSSSFAGDIEVAGNLVVGGASGTLKMLDVLSNKSIRNTFRQLIKSLQLRAREVAKELGKVSRIARKYLNDEESEILMSVEAGDYDDESDTDGDDLNNDMEEDD